MITQDATVEETVDQLAEAAENAGMAALRLTIDAYAERAGVASRQARARLEEARGYAARVQGEEGDSELRSAQRAAHEACLFALEANVLARLHRRYIEHLRTEQSLQFFNTFDEDTREMLAEREEIAGFWDDLEY